MRFHFLPLLLLVLPSCTSVQNNVAPGTLAPPRNVLVTVKEGASGDARVRTAIEHELLQRGLRGGQRLMVEFEDTWHWDIVMFLRALSVTFVDDKGHLIGSVSWRQKGLHVYPSQESAVRDIFQALDSVSAFQPNH